MPSGSHSGGGGHSGGFSGGGSWGGHSGGSHRSGSDSSSYTISSGKRNGRSVVIFTGLGGHNGRYIRSSVFTLFVIMIMMFGFMLFVFGLGSMGSPAEVKENYQHDYNYYQSMIRYAENNPEYMLTTGAIITDRLIGKGGNKYYLAYMFYTSINHQAVKGYTYTTYTLEDLERPELQVGQTIALALNCKNTQLTFSTDSIDLNYKNTTLEDDGDFIYDYNIAKKSVDIGITISLIGVALIIVGAVILFVLKQKKDDNPELSTVESVQEKKKEYCTYCGALLKDGALKCDNCGASVSVSSDKENNAEKEVSKSK